MITALDDLENVKNAFDKHCNGYLVKPVTKDKIINKLKELKLIESENK